MTWLVEFHQEFDAEFENLSEHVQNAILVKALLLAKEGPRLGRPHADTLIGSNYANMKELRCRTHDGVWRTAFAFDPERKAILLIAGNKLGVNEKRFYKKLIGLADRRYAGHTGY